MANPVIFTRQFAEVVRRLHEQNVRATDPQLRIKFLNAWHIVLGGSVAQRASQIPVDLPDLEDRVQADIIKDNVRALAALYFSAQLEDLKFFQVADKVTEQFLAGMIPISRSAGSTRGPSRSAPARSPARRASAPGSAPGSTTTA